VEVHQVLTQVEQEVLQEQVPILQLPAHQEQVEVDLEPVMAVGVVVAQILQ